MQQVRLALVPILEASGFMVAWSTVQASRSIAYQELFPVVIAAHLRGSLWARKHVLFRSDNEGVVTILTTKTSKVPA